MADQTKQVPQKQNMVCKRTRRIRDLVTKKTRLWSVMIIHVLKDMLHYTEYYEILKPVVDSIINPLTFF